MSTNYLAQSVDKYVPNLYQRFKKETCFSTLEYPTMGDMSVGA